MSFVHPEIKHVVALMAVHNRLALTQRCVACLRAAATGVTLEIVVVDDGSTDGTAEWLAAQPDVTALRGDGGLWFGGATDTGLRHLRERRGPNIDFALVLNNDTFLRPGALAMMAAAAVPDAVVATAYWTTDKRELCTTGYVWRRWRGLVDASRTGNWPAEGSGCHTIPVSAVSTTVVMVPMGLLRKTRLPDPAWHPHNRYDAMFSARLRDAGANFVCLTEVLADHEYGVLQARSTVRTMTLSTFLTESFRERRSIWHLRGGLALAWETAPNGAEAAWAWLTRWMRFGRQLAWVCLNSMRRARFGDVQEVRA
jgi:N-acetylglucosaminyl-diphospho-decaprenol L-rhamnosyltransferase